MYDRLDKYLTEDQKEKINDDFYESVKKYPVQIHDIDGLAIVFNSRLKTCAGKFKWWKSEERSVIELNPKYLKQFGFEHVRKTFLHELAHFIQYSIYGYTNHDEMFKKICANLGGHMNDYVAGKKYQEFVCNEYIKSENKWHYECLCGRNDFKTKRRLNKKTLLGSCSKCGQRVIDFERQIG